jgi:predicted HTH transcriptional regulator
VNVNRFEDLAERIGLGEDSVLELKSVVVAGDRVEGPSRNEFADELAAFANTKGGTVVLGVDDRTRKVTGIPLDSLDAVEGWVREICNDSVKPALDADIYKLNLQGASGRAVPVICIEISRSLFVHRSPGGYFRRLGSSKREMAPELLARLFEQRSQSRIIRFDESVVPGTTPSDLDYALTRRFLRERLADEGVTEELARKLRVVADDDRGVSRLTLAGVLLCTREPQRWLPHAYIQAVSYAGERTDIDYQTDTRDIGGPLDEQVAEALHFVQRNMLVRATKSTARTEHPQFGERAAFEALVNAVAHRDYSLAGARIRLHMFSDRIELYVPGALPNTLTPDSMHLRQSSRNELIVSLLAQCQAPANVGRSRLMDRRGDGVPIIRDECEKLSGCLPEYAMIDESELRLVIPAAKTLPAA